MPACRARTASRCSTSTRPQRIRALGWRGPVLLLEGCFEPRDLELCSRLNLWHTVHCEMQIDMLAAHKTSTPQRVFLKMNSGMNRLGFRPEAYRAAWQRLSGLTQVDDIVLMTHFSDADGAAGVAAQLAAFEAATRELPGERSLANSAATLRFASGDALVRADWVRPGIMVYGSAPDFPAHDAAGWALEPAMTLKSHLIATQDLRAGDRVGYGSSFVADAPMRIGVVACGYADGYPRVAPTGTPVLVERRAHAHRRAGVDGHDHGRPRARAGRRDRQRGHALGPRPGRQPAVDRRGGGVGRHGRLRADVRAGAARADVGGMTLAVAPEEVEISAVRAQGAGGQNVNKVSSAVHLRFDIRASSLPDAVKERLLRLAIRASARTACWCSRRRRTAART